ncbi:MarR family transcriptional regulator [Streptomyces broussonetiae]|uniref:MarR family transcriptional regulator n=1 Tax=Streptomyces broussonetiae TaxID=2686304 RepID=A0A6I6NFC5_9ACTN|nr:MarR family transcriptional regulator [Streptomyces broussonetiae]
MTEDERELPGLVRELVTLSRRFRSNADRLHPDLSFVDYSLLSEMAERGGVRAGDLVGLYSLNKSTISRQVTALQRDGLVVRETDPDNPRASCCTPATAAGNCSPSPTPGCAARSTPAPTAGPRTRSGPCAPFSPATTPPPPSPPRTHDAPAPAPDTSGAAARAQEADQGAQPCSAPRVTAEPPPRVRRLRVGQPGGPTPPDPPGSTDRGPAGVREGDEAGRSRQGRAVLPHSFRARPGGSFRGKARRPRGFEDPAPTQPPPRADQLARPRPASGGGPHEEPAARTLPTGAVPSRSRRPSR